jgi:glucose-6-phosphate dehydrogenase assembly protein OpcA
MSKEKKRYEQRQKERQLKQANNAEQNEIIANKLKLCEQRRQLQQDILDFNDLKNLIWWSSIAPEFELQDTINKIKANPILDPNNANFNRAILVAEKDRYHKLWLKTLNFNNMNIRPDLNKEMNAGPPGGPIIHG